MAISVRARDASLRLAFTYLEVTASDCGTGGNPIWDLKLSSLTATSKIMFTWRAQNYIITKWLWICYILQENHTIRLECVCVWGSVSVQGSSLRLHHILRGQLWLHVQGPLMVALTPTPLGGRSWRPNWRPTATTLRPRRGGNNLLSIYWCPRYSVVLEYLWNSYWAPPVQLENSGIAPLSVKTEQKTYWNGDAVTTCASQTGSTSDSF